MTDISSALDSLAKVVGSMAEETPEPPKPTFTSQVNVHLGSRMPVLSGFRLTPGDVVRLTRQTNPAENGLYTVEADYSLSRL